MRSFWRRPEPMGAPDNPSAADRSKIAAVEAAGGIAEKKDLGLRQTVAALPGWHRTARAIAALGCCGDASVDQDCSADAAYPIAGDRRDRLQNVIGELKIAALVGKPGGVNRQLDEGKVVQLRSHSLNAIEADGDARGRIPNQDQR